MAIYGTLGEIDLGALSASISDTAVDIFIYDTSKDSDGGAWRKRTQHTSWYNETLNTATRGSRREFPAVAVIVISNASAGLTIYDGDDPDLPMWMVFNETGGQSIWTGTDRSSVAALNGIIVVGQLTTIPLPIIGFVADEMYNRRTDTTKYNISNIAGRNTGGYSITGYFDQGLVNATANDVAMTVLPNAPIDDATGLPIPTIAVATDGGVSVIKDDGNVFDLTFSGQNGSKVWKITFDDNYQICMLLGYSNVYPYTSYIYHVPSSDTSLSAVTDRVLNNSTYNFPSNAYGAQNTSSGDINAYIDSKYFGTDNGMSFLTPNKNDIGGQLICHINTQFNSGWQHGDIKGAFLSDTDATNVTGTELVTNGTFDTDTTGWAFQRNDGTTTASVSSGQLTLTRGNDSGVDEFRQDITFETGKRYVVTIRKVSGNVVFRLNESTLSQQILNGANTTYSYTVTATGTAGVVRVWALSNNTSITVDDISVRLAEEDRSVNNNGLQVFGTITKSAVATGAELVAYSGFSSSNYLQMPSGSVGINTSTNGPLTIMCWFKGSLNGSDPQCLIMIGPNTTYEARGLLLSGTGTLGFFRWGSDPISSRVVTDNTWHHCVGTLSYGNVKLYVDGVQVYSDFPSLTNSSSTQVRIGYSNGGNVPLVNGSLSLCRVSNSVASPEQIKKIYEDEKVLFQENAACTLYGSSDAVTALAYDEVTERLHVGTSSGRSDFQGLRRINNTTTAVTTAISAHDEFIVEQ